jgi:hypothetical protein
VATPTQKWRRGCGGSHLKSLWRHKPRKAGQDGVQPVRAKIPGNRLMFPTFPSQVFYFICETIFTSHTSSVSHTLSLMIYLLTAHRSNDKYCKMRLDSLSRISCTHDLQPSGNVTHNVACNVIDVASHSEDKLHHATNKASVARVATSMTLSTSRRDVVWPIDPWRRKRRWVWPGTYYVN